MGRDATKAAGNPWYQARKKAAEYDDRLCSRESAAEQLGMSVSSLADAELGNTKFMPVDKAVLMADRYNAPWLLNHYCLNECPIGCRHSLSDEVVGIDRVTVKLLKSLKTEKLGDVKDTLLDIAADGKITEDEKPALQEVLAYVSGWQGVDVVPDPPVPLIDEEIKRIRAAGYRVVVVSTRCATPEGMGAVRRYLRENGIEVDDVAAEKPPAKVYVDDRALLFDGNPKGLLEKIQQFRPWQEGGPLRGKPPAPNCRKCIAHVYERTNDGWREDEFVAWFHTWGSTFEEFDNGAVPVTTGIVEDEHGKVWNTAAENIRFID